MRAACSLALDYDITPFDITFSSRSNRFMRPFIPETPPLIITAEAISRFVSVLLVVNLPKKQRMMLLICD